MAETRDLQDRHVFRSRTAPPHWQATTRRSIRRAVGGASFADALLAIAWLVLVADLLRSAARAGVPAGRRLTGVLLLAIMLAAAWTLETASGGRLGWHPAGAVLGLALAAAGLALHAWARATLAGGWSSIVTPPAGAALMEAGPYAYVRHPLYAAILLLAAGTLIAH